MTIKDIANLSGYGVGTVSRVLNNHPDVSDKARTKILEVIEQSNFEPNTNARHLKMRAGSSIGVIVKGMQNMLFADILERIQNHLSECEENAEVEYIDEDGDEVAYAVKMCKNSNPKGILFLGANLQLFDERFEEVNVPCMIVTTDGKELERETVSSISVDDEQAIYEITRTLVLQGHKNIGMLGGYLTTAQVGFTRYKGCERALTDNGIAFDRTRQFEPSRYSMESGYRAAKKLIERNPDMTAVVCFSDTIALGAIRAMKDMGKSVPEDISVVGFDGIDLANYSMPRLTTVKQDTATMAGRSVDILLHHIHYPGKAEHIRVPYTLIEGESVRSV